MRSKEFAPERFWPKVDIRGEGECWPWIAAKSNSGYGVFEGNSAHRVALALSTGENPVGMDAMHSCHNRVCVNPAHLSWGSRTRNIRDALAEGRRFGQQKLSPEQVATLRAERSAGARLKELAERYGLSVSGVSRIVNRETWPEVA